MAEPGQEKGKTEQRFARSVNRRARRLRRDKDDRSAWFCFGMFGMVGWSVAVPAVALAALGAWLDRRWPGKVSWTLTLLVTGIILGCWMAWNWVRSESRHDDDDK